jgi:plastocyanin
MPRLSTNGACRLAVSLGLAVSALGLVSIEARGAIPPPAATAVQIKDFAFAPQVLTVKPGTTVTWVNADEDPHTVTANDKSFHSAALDTHDKFTFTFTKPGEYGYFCSLHPHMTAKIVVKG